MKKPGIRSNKTNYRNGAGFISAPFKKNTGLKNGAGLTLIELLVVISIMMTMTAVVFVNYRPGNQQLALNRSASKLAQDIRRAQEMAMGSRVEGACGPGFEGSYGIKFSRLPPVFPGPNLYILFADCNDSGNYDAGDEIIEGVTFEQGVVFDRVKYRYPPGSWLPVGVGVETIDIIFSPPDPERSISTINPLLNNAPEQMLRIKLDSSGQFKNIYVNSAGLIYVE